MAILEFGTREVSEDSAQKATARGKHGNCEYTGKLGTAYRDWQTTPRKEPIALDGDRV